MNNETIYISGPMTGYAENNKEAFLHGEHRLHSLLSHRKEPYIIYNPINVILHKNATYDDYMCADLFLLLKTRSIYMLKNFERSKGAGLELFLSAFLHYKIYFEVSYRGIKKLFVFLRFMRTTMGIMFRVWRKVWNEMNGSLID